MELRWRNCERPTIDSSARSCISSIVLENRPRRFSRRALGALSRHRPGVDNLAAALEPLRDEIDVIIDRARIDQHVGPHRATL